MTVEEWLGKDNKLGIDIWNKKYRYNGETFDEFLDRVSGGNESVRELIKEKKFLFAGRILASRGVPGNRTLSNCYVAQPPEDNLESIFDTAKQMARTYSYGGGCGVDLGNLAPRGAKVHNTAKESSGAASFMELYNTTTSLIGQNGRRGALMISMPIWHPDIEEFIDAKKNTDKLNSCNISVRVTDAFMIAVDIGSKYLLRFKRMETGETIEKEVDARELFHKLCENNWNYAEPGMLFWDTIENGNMLSADPNFHYAGVNPCAEEPLPANGACLLGSINLAEFMADGNFDFDGFDCVVETAVKALNEVLDEGIDRHPLEAQRETSKGYRQIGLGIMGLADCLAKLRITYGSKDAVDFCKVLARDFETVAVTASESEGFRHGDYPNLDRWAVWKSSYLKQNNLQPVHLRNSQLLCIAPTGTLSTMLGISGGIGPIFANSYTRKTQSLDGKDTFYKVYTPVVEQYMKENGITDEADLPEWFVTAKDIKPEDRLKMQATWQKYIDASISSTINLPNSATVEDVEKIYMQAWKLGLKGVTIYREGCAREGVLTTDKKEPEQHKAPKKEDKIIGLERHLTTGCGSLHVCAFFHSDGRLENTYLSKGSTGGCNNYMIGLSRMMSLAARSGVPIEKIVDQLASCGTCPSYAVRNATKHDTSKGSCCPMAVGNALLDMQKEILRTCIDSKETATEATEKPENDSSEKCPMCGAPLAHTNGCVSCTNCPWSKCE